MFQVIYTTFGLPWPGSNPRGPMSNAAPFINEVFHENAYLNFLSFKRYIEQNENDHNISFYKTNVQRMLEQIIYIRMRYLVESTWIQRGSSSLYKSKRSN